MNTAVAHCIHIYCVLILFVIVCNAGDMNEPKRYSNDLGLIPFPRVGRREAVLKLAKLRNELFAFPRIGRSQSTPLDMKRNSPKTMNTGLWFGPRLGRVQKRNPYVYSSDLDDYYNSIAADGKQGRHYTSHLGQTSEEDLDQLGPQPEIEDS